MCHNLPRGFARFFLLLLVFSAVNCISLYLANADSGARTNRLRICTQNLNNFQVEGRKRPHSSVEKHVQFLLQRIKEASCDVIAVQEVGGATKRIAHSNLEILSQALSRDTDRKFNSYVGKSDDGWISNGFIVADDVGKFLDLKSLTGANLPKLQPLGRSHRFIRGPVKLAMLVGSKRAKNWKKLVFFNMHLKSKSNSWKDPTKTSFETLRMEMAEALRIAAEREEEKGEGDRQVVIVLGDRNSDGDSASADILAGRLFLADFSTPSKCMLDSQLRSSCSNVSRRSPFLVSLFGEEGFSPSMLQKRGSYMYKGKPYWLDDILVAKDDFRYFQRPDGSMAIGLEGQFNVGSDHKLLWAEMGW